jgi:hypothetical protein
MIKMDYCYQLFNPSGNVTALILGLEKNGQLRRRATQKIMEIHPEVEQVGFVSLDKKDPRLMMAGRLPAETPSGVAGNHRRKRGMNNGSVQCLQICAGLDHNGNGQRKNNVPSDRPQW